MPKAPDGRVSDGKHTLVTLPALGLEADCRSNDFHQRIDDEVKRTDDKPVFDRVLC